MMNRDTLAGSWMQLKGKFHSQWGKLSNDEIEQAEGNFEMLAGALQKRYGLAKEKAEQALDGFIKSINEANAGVTKAADPAPAPTHRESIAKPVLSAALLAFAVLGAACAATIVPAGSMDSSEATIRAADELGASNVPQANLHLQLAKEEAEQARALLKKNDKDRAAYVWMRAEADAALALALARESVARNEALTANAKLTAPKAE